MNDYILYKQKDLVYDIEADGLLSDSTRIHCLIAKEIGGNRVWKFWDNDVPAHNFGRHGDEYQGYLNKGAIEFLFKRCNKIICHNQIGYDIPMIKKFFNIDIYSIKKPEQIIDTYVWSQVLNPDRELPLGCPTRTSITPELKALGYKTKTIGAHGLESWGWRCGNHKIEIYDWKTFTPSILTRCEVDVNINEKTYLKLLKEAGID